MAVSTFIACPECDSDKLSETQIVEEFAEPFASKVGLRCESCSRFYPMIDGIYILWSDDLKRMELSEADAASNISHAVKMANISIYDEVNAVYGEHHDGSYPYSQTQLFQKAIANDQRRSAENISDSIIVDVGCATGNGLDIGSSGFKYRVGVDISLNNLRHVVRKGHIPVLADAEKLPFGEGSIDMITCFASLHHFPEPARFVASAYKCLREGGVLLVAGEPTESAMKMSPLARIVWDLRKPVYRFLGHFSDRFYLHQNKDQQELNDLAEFNRTEGGFSPSTIEGYINAAGFAESQLFYGTDPSFFRKYSMPPWQPLILKTLSLQNPFKVSNWMNLTAIAVK